MSRVDLCKLKNSVNQDWRDSVYNVGIVAHLPNYEGIVYMNDPCTVRVCYDDRPRMSSVSAEQLHRANVLQTKSGWSIDPRATPGSFLHDHHMMPFPFPPQLTSLDLFHTILGGVCPFTNALLFRSLTRSVAPCFRVAMAKPEHRALQSSSTWH